MFLTAEHLSTPFWCFAVLESSSHPPVRNLLCDHQTEMASVWRGKHKDEITIHKSNYRQTNKKKSSLIFWTSLFTERDVFNSYLSWIHKHIGNTIPMVDVINQCYAIKNKPFAQEMVMQNWNLGTDSRDLTSLPRFELLHQSWGRIAVPNPVREEKKYKNKH